MRVEFNLIEIADSLLPILEQLVRADTWEESRCIVEENAKVLSDEADQLLSSMINMSRSRGDGEAVRLFEEQRDLLRSCRQRGITKTFAEKMLPREVVAWAEVEGISLEELLYCGRELDRFFEGKNVPQYHIQEFARILERQQYADNKPEMLLGVVGEWEHFLQFPEVQQTKLFSARARNNLAIACNNLYEILGTEVWANRATVLLEDLLAVFTKTDYPQDWARVHYCLGNLNALRFERTGNTDFARQWDMHYASALEEYLPEVALAEWATVKHGQGILYARRYEYSGDDACATQADECYREALKAYQQTPVQKQRAVIQHSLGNLHARIYERSDTEANARQADEYYREALTIRCRDPLSSQCATSQHSLASLNALRYERTGDTFYVQRADECYQAALEVFRREIFPVQWASVQHGLGVLNSSRYERTGDDTYALLADNCYHAALRETRRKKAPSKWAMLQHNLANLYAHRHVRSENRFFACQARRRYALVLAGANRHGLSDTFTFRAAAALLRLQVRLRTWQEAAKAFDIANCVFDELYHLVTSRGSKEAWLREAQSLPANAAYALAKLDRLEEAVEALEAGRARLLAEALEANRRDLDQLASLGHGDLLDRYSAASEQVTSLQQSSQSASPAAEGPAVRPDFATLRRQMEDARNELNAAIAAIRQVPGYEDFFLPPSFEKIQRAATPNAPLVYLLTTSAGSLALVVRAAAQKSDFSPASPVETVWLDNLDELGLREALIGPVDGSEPGGYLGAYDGWQRNPRDRGARDRWFDTLDSTTRWLWDALMGPVVAQLPSSLAGEGWGEGESPPCTRLSFPPAFSPSSPCTPPGPRTPKRPPAVVMRWTPSPSTTPPAPALCPTPVRAPHASRTAACWPWITPTARWSSRAMRWPQRVPTSRLTIPSSSRATTLPAGTSSTGSPITQSTTSPPTAGPAGASH